MELPSQAQRTGPTVDIVIPVFNAPADVRRCVDSVLACATVTRSEVIIVDDASTDPQLKSYLTGLASHGKVRLLRNDKNSGFVSTANRGMREHPDRDVVLLNSDTEVANDWLDRIVACAYRAPDVGTVTPFSNNATICSFPVFCGDNPLPDALTTADVDHAFARANAGASLDLPTGVGFCMFIRRACLEQVGYFDEQRFGRGYGEENDFCRRALQEGWRSVLCADAFVFHAGGASFGAERTQRMREAEPALLAIHPEYLEAVKAFVRLDPPAPFRRAVEIELARSRTPQPGESPLLKVSPLPASSPAGFSYLSPRAREILAVAQGRPVQLHVVHDLGGGVYRWCRDYCQADDERVNLILKPFCHGHAAGEGLMLFAALDDIEPIGFWAFDRPFEITTVHHEAYAQVFRSILDMFDVGAVLVSSLIGHALDCLSSGRPTVLVMHDYFPACPAINLYFGGVCGACDDQRLTDCHGRNFDFNAFPQYLPDERLAVRKRFLDILVSRQVVVAAPSRSVQDNLMRLFPQLSGALWVVIPHGANDALVPLDRPTAATGKLKIVVLGMLSVAKGQYLLDQALTELSSFAEIHLVGTQEVGAVFAGRPGVHVITRYQLGELQEIMQRISPDVGLLMSILPETFGYTLTELTRLAIPPVVTDLGSFSERVIDGETGYLVQPNAEALIARLKAIDKDREGLARVRSHLSEMPRRDCRDMVADYHRLLPLTGGRKATSLPAGTDSPAVAESLCVRQAVALSAMWKQVKSLDLQLAITRETKSPLEGPGQIAEHQRRTAERQLAIAEHQRAVSEQQRAVSEQQRALAEIQFNHERQQWLQRLSHSADMIRERDQAVRAKDNRIQELTIHLDTVSRQLTEVLSSTSWRVSSPLRSLGNALRRTRLLLRCFVPLVRNPLGLPRELGKLALAWKSGGLLQLKLALLALRADGDHQDAWKDYQRKFATDVRPRVVEAVQAMSERPLISVIVPTFNTNIAMLRQMFDSLQGQLYPEWELCIADDCSSDSRVRSAIEQFAKVDSRVKTHFGATNEGVAHASNRALALATGKFVVLLDHDDVLAEHALFRVAQSVLADDPDMVYSDEIMVSPEGSAVLQYAHRPAFSPELLRSHPYIVHLVGFRTELLREIGGFDETLRISQDYDLILRIVERARKIVHFPELLYQWRIHGKSAGKQKMKEVMATSKGVLQRHLDRLGEPGEVRDGARFNLFDVRYPLAAGLRVAIVIPTKNHGDLVRQCIESIRKTVIDAAYDIVVVDHESTDPETLAYFSSLAPAVSVHRYQGPFNFSAINNWAVAQLGGRHSHYLFCNNDIEARTPGWLERMLELGQKPDVGIVGAQLLYPDGITIQHAGVCVGAFGAAEHFAKFIPVPDIPKYLFFSEIMSSNHEVSAVTAACLLIKREAFEAVSGFDEALAVGFGDVDLCLRVGQLGYRILQCPHAELIHHESFTRGKTSGMDPHPADSSFFQARWQWFLEAGDPYFNPALYQNSVAWQIRQPMRCSFDSGRRVFAWDSARTRQSFSTGK